MSETTKRTRTQKDFRSILKRYMDTTISTDHVVGLKGILLATTEDREALMEIGDELDEENNDAWMAQIRAKMIYLVLMSGGEDGDLYVTVTQTFTDEAEAIKEAALCNAGDDEHDYRVVSLPMGVRGKWELL